MFKKMLGGDTYQHQKRKPTVAIHLKRQQLSCSSVVIEKTTDVEILLINKH